MSSLKNLLSLFVIEQASPSEIAMVRKDHRSDRDVRRCIELMREATFTRGRSLVESTPDSHRPRTIQRQQGQQMQMTTMSPVVLGVRAAAFVDSDAVTPVYRRQRGFAGGTAITRNGAGDYTLTLQDALDTAAGGDLYIYATPQNNAFAAIAVDLPTVTTLRTRTCAMTAVPAVTATDLDYWIGVSEFGPN